VATAEELRVELEGLRREIDELREYEHQIETALGAIPRPLRWLRAPDACLLKKEVGRRIESLRLRYNIVHNCYLAKGREANGRAGRSARSEGRTFPADRRLR
jgi:hypothetical protein